MPILPGGSFEPREICESRLESHNHYADLFLKMGKERGVSGAIISRLVAAEREMATMYAAALEADQ